MNNINIKNIIIIVGIIILIILLVILLTFLLKKTPNEVAKKEEISHDIVEKLYNDLDKKENTSEKEYVSKLYGYTYDENNNLKMTVKEGYVQNNKVYNLEGKEIGDYNKDTLNKVLDNGTLKTYDYSYEEGKYNLNK